VSNGYDKTLREFLTEFQGLSRSAATKAITDKLPGINRLSDLSQNNIPMRELLALMQEKSTKPKPSILRCLSKEHFQNILGEDGFQYKKLDGVFEHEGAHIPYIIEAASAKWEQDHTDQLIGVNHSMTYTDPFSGTNYYVSMAKGDKTFEGWGLSGLLRDLKISENDGFRLVLHLICPNIQYTDKSKSKFDAKPFMDAVSEAVYQTCKKHYKEKKAGERQKRSYEREKEQKKEKPEKISIKDAVFWVIKEAVFAASGGGMLPYSARTLYYQVRPRIQKYTQMALEYGYFTPQLLTEYQDIHGPLIGLYYEPTGQMIEPHTNNSVPLGTLDVESYRMPDYVFNKILYVEKMGLLCCFT
jgi:hypothetical protein